MILQVDLLNDPQGRVLETPAGIAFAVILGVVFLIWFLVTKGDMGTHADTGRPVKSLNTSDGKRARQRRAYNRNTYGVDVDPYDHVDEIKDKEARIRAIYQVEIDDFEKMKAEGTEDFFGTHIDEWIKNSKDKMEKDIQEHRKAR